MKKLLYFFSAALITLTSCSDNDDNKSSSSGVLVQKRISHESDGKSYSEHIVYDGNKIVSIADKYRNVKTFTYDGDLITKTVTTNSFGEIVSATDYEYNTNKKLTSSLTTNAGSASLRRVEYAYKENDIVEYEASDIDVTSKVEEVYGTGKYTIKNGNLIKKEFSYQGEGTRESVTYQYDDKYAPFKNVAGLSLLLDSEEAISLNNVITKQTVIGLNNNLEVETYSYKYGENNYPVEKIIDYQDESLQKNIIEFHY